MQTDEPVPAPVPAPKNLALSAKLRLTVGALMANIETRAWRAGLEGPGILPGMEGKHYRPTHCANPQKKAKRKARQKAQRRNRAPKKKARNRG